jgi:hypothetical protein
MAHSMFTRAELTRIELNLLHFFQPELQYRSSRIYIKNEGLLVMLLVCVFEEPASNLG